MLSNKCGFQLQYQMIFCVWLLAFSPQLCEQLRRYNVVPALSDILQESVKEKVTRIILAAFRVSGTFLVGFFFFFLFFTFRCLGGMVGAVVSTVASKQDGSSCSEPVHVWVFSELSGFLPQSKDVLVRRIDQSELTGAGSVSGCVPFS